MIVLSLKDKHMTSIKKLLTIDESQILTRVSPFENKSEVYVSQAYVAKLEASLNAAVGVLEKVKNSRINGINPTAVRRLARKTLIEIEKIAGQK